MSEYIAPIIPKKRAPRRHSAIYCADLPSSVRLCFGQPCSPFEAGALPVLRPARRIHIRLRGRVLCNPPRLKGFRPAAAQNKAAQCTLGNWANVACVRRSRALAAPSGFALRAQPTRRLRRGRIFGEKLDSSRALHPSSAARYFVGGIPPSRLATCTTAHPPNRAVACRSARHSARRSASSPHVKPIQATTTATN